MLELTSSYTFSRIPYITDEALDGFAEAVVGDFAPERLNVPGSLDVESFLKDYLGLKIEYRKISYLTQTLGLTAFSDGYVQINDDITDKPALVPVKKGTVVIDTSLLKSKYPYRLRFTLAHEGSHWLLHRKAFEENNPFKSVGVSENQQLAAKKGRVDYSRSLKDKTDCDTIERQADFLAAAILMPRPALREEFRDFFRIYGEKPRQLARLSGKQDEFYSELLPLYVSKTFNVSYNAARIRLEKLKAIVDRKTLSSVKPAKSDKVIIICAR
jgi:Zn-dependent peptidase ImmA (M78 family)